MKSLYFFNIQRIQNNKLQILRYVFENYKYNFPKTQKNKSNI